MARTSYFLTSNGYFFIHIMARTSYFLVQYGNVCFVLDQYNQLYFYNARSLKQQSTCRHIASLGYIILVPSRSYSLLLLAQKQQSTCRHIASLGYTILVPSRSNSLLLLVQRRSSKYKCYSLWFSTTFSVMRCWLLLVAGANRSIQRIPSTCCKSPTNYIGSCIEYTSPSTRMELTNME